MPPKSKTAPSRAVTLRRGKTARRVDRNSESALAQYNPKENPLLFLALIIKDNGDNLDVKIIGEEEQHTVLKRGMRLEKDTRKNQHDRVYALIQRDSPKSKHMILEAILTQEQAGRAMRILKRENGEEVNDLFNRSGGGRRRKTRRAGRR